ncbi:MAG: FecR domain-containing protein [Nitrosomonadales bacterium]|nr:FecR domain-containing protein [Nitrosomonadales bacterium]
MQGPGETEDPRRRVLIRALAAGLFAAGLPGAALAGGIFGSRPARLPAGQSIYRISGRATVNGKEATLATRINPGDTVQTAKDSEIVFTVNGSHSMILRGDSHLDIEPAQDTAGSLLIGGLRLLTGKLLSVSRNAPMRVSTVTATLGIRGTGFYVESDPALTYFCTCYGTTDIAANADPESRTTVESKHHDRPLYIVSDAERGKNIRNAPFINHTDQELTLIEALVGRTTPFVFENDSYSGPRRDY